MPKTEYMSELVRCDRLDAELVLTIRGHSIRCEPSLTSIDPHIRGDCNLGVIFYPCTRDCKPSARQLADIYCVEIVDNLITSHCIVLDADIRTSFCLACILLTCIDNI